MENFSEETPTLNSALQAQCDSSCDRSHKARHALPAAALFFPSASALLDAIDKCTGCFCHWVGNDPAKQSRFRERISQWKAAGRPLLEWPQIPSANLSTNHHKVNVKNLLEESS